jgi:UDP-glucuronate 4-epimerase
MKILVTGAAGFIGFHTTKLLVSKGHSVVGLDNLNDYYSVSLKISRLNDLGFNDIAAIESQNLIYSDKHNSDCSFIKMNLEDATMLSKLFEEEQFDIVCHLAAQAGVRYSIQNPKAYIDSNVVGFANILECCRNYQIKHLVYASSSSVYGLNDKVPFETSDRTDSPISLYAATKKSNELMAHTYSHLFDIPTTGLRFFTVYGPWGRPDMALFLFVDAIKKGNAIKVFNHGDLARDFTYVDDIVKGVVKIVETPLEQTKRKNEKYKLYNIGNNQQVRLTDFITAIENALGISAKKIMMPMQDGDVATTWANVDDLINDYNYKPNTPIDVGVNYFVDWYQKYYSN